MAAEDRDFYTNPGFSFTGFARAFKNNLFGGDPQGGSTITQQYVKNALVGDAAHRASAAWCARPRNWSSRRRCRGEWSKDQVLQAYLNIIYFGRGAYGISAASKAYFDKPVEQLTVAEGALLAALIQRPSTLDPAVDPEGAARAVELGARRHGRHRGAVHRATARRRCSRRRCRRTRPAQQNQTTGPERADRAAGHQGTARPVQHRRADAEHPGPADHHDDRPARRSRPPRTRSPKYLDGQDPDMRAAVVSIDPKTGGGEGLLRRLGRQRLRLRAGRVADRIVVQGVRVGGRAASRASAWATRWTARR